VTGCAGCTKVRRALIRHLPARLAAPAARLLLPTTTTAADVVAEARTWVGVPYRHQGRTRRGVDCLGVPIVVLHALGVPFREAPPDYGPDPPPGELDRRFLRHCTPLPGPVPGCAIALRLSGPTPHHVALLTDRDTLIHVARRDAVAEHGFRGMWRTRFYSGAWALPGVAY
jgi:cell wall-associated NlpC family hydrolase